jgi:hypothetical protein
MTRPSRRCGASRFMTFPREFVTSWNHAHDWTRRKRGQCGRLRAQANAAPYEGRSLPQGRLQPMEESRIVIVSGKIAINNSIAVVYNAGTTASDYPDGIVF